MYEEEDEEVDALDNPRRRRVRHTRTISAARRALLKAVGLRTQALIRKGLDKSDAMAQAWEEARSGRRRAAPAKPAARKPAGRKPAARKPAGRKPAAAAARKPAARKPAARKPARRASSRRNPWYDSLYLPDTTHTGPALVRASYPWEDGTMVRSDLVPGPYTKSNPSEFESSPEPSMWEYHPVYDQTIGQFSTGESFTRGIQPMNRRNPRKKR